MISVPMVTLTPEAGIRLAAMEWAQECGMHGVIRIQTVEKRAYGWQIALANDEGKTAEARFTSDGKRNMWEVTSR